MQTYVGNVLKWREKKREIEMCMWLFRVKLKGEGQKKTGVIFDSITHHILFYILVLNKNIKYHMYDINGEKKERSKCVCGCCVLN